MKANILVRWLEGQGAVPAAEVRAGLGVSSSTLSRLVADAPPRLQRLGQGRATHYALMRSIERVKTPVPIYRVDEGGVPSFIGDLKPLSGGGTWVEPESGSGWAHAGLPPVVADMAPAGFLGHAFAICHPELELPRRLQDWSDDHRLIALTRRGEDCPGDLIVGAESLNRFLDADLLEGTHSDFFRLSHDAASGEVGSSAAGEQPKFTVFMDGAHYIVKFTPGDRSPSDERWSDLLRCEAIALEVLSDGGVDSAAAHIARDDQRVYLAVRRFDRIGERGRRGTITLGPVDDDLFGYRDSWSAAADRLLDRKLIVASDHRRIRLLDCFGALIANTDRHFGNLSFFVDQLSPEPSLTLTPVYDMLPMALMPRYGALPDAPSSVPRCQAELLDVWAEGCELAVTFWTRVMDEAEISDAFRRIAGGYLDGVREAVL